jgi:hypothetical protein
VKGGFFLLLLSLLLGRLALGCLALGCLGSRRHNQANDIVRLCAIEAGNPECQIVAHSDRDRRACFTPNLAEAGRNEIVCHCIFESGANYFRKSLAVKGRSETIGESDIDDAVFHIVVGWLRPVTITELPSPYQIRKT